LGCFSLFRGLVFEKLKREEEEGSVSNVWRYTTTPLYLSMAWGLFERGNYLEFLISRNLIFT
jgi:hypothetical protein